MEYSPFVKFLTALQSSFLGSGGRRSSTSASKGGSGGKGSTGSGSMESGAGKRSGFQSGTGSMESGAGGSSSISKQMNMLLRTKSDSGKKLTDEVSEQHLFTISEIAKLSVSVFFIS